jgi:hypothetical protein
MTPERALCVRVDDSTVDAWEDLRVGDRVRLRLPGRSDGNPDVFDVVELRFSEDVLSSGAREAVAVVRGLHGEIETMNARMLRKVT